MTTAAAPHPARRQPPSGIGDRLRHWWNSLSRPAQWGVGAPIIVLIALLPVIKPPFLDTAPATDFGGVIAQFGMYALIAIGLNVVVGSAGLLDLGYVGFYAVGAYTVALFSSPYSPWNHHRTGEAARRELGVAGAAPGRHSRHGGVGPDPRFAHPPTARRLPGHRDAGIRRDRPAAGRQPQRHHPGRPGTAQRRLPPGRWDRHQSGRGVLPGQRDRPVQQRRLVVLAVNRAGRHRAGVRRQPRALSGGAGLDRDPGGRGRRGDHGRSHLQVQAVGVRDRRVHRRHVGRAVRGSGPVRGPDELQRGQLRAVPVRRRARRSGEQARGDPRRVHHRVPAQPSAEHPGRRASPWASTSTCSSASR